MSHARSISKASISMPVSQSMEANRDSFTEQPRTAPSPTNTPREARGSFDRGRRPSFPTRQPSPLTSGYIPSGGTEKPPLARTVSPSVSRGHRRGASTDSQFSISSKESTTSVLSRRASVYLCTNFRYKLKQNIFDPSLPADGDVGEIDEATRRSLFKDDPPKKPSLTDCACHHFSRESLASIAPSLARRVSRDSTSTDTKPPSLIQRTRKVSGKIANGVSDALQSAAQSAAQGAQNVAQSAQSAAHRLNTHMMSRTERAAQSRRHANHANARAALGGQALRRVQSTSQLDAYTPSYPTRLPWEDYSAARAKDAQRQSQSQSQDKGQDKKRPAFSPFSLLKKTSKQTLREVSARNISSPEVTWISPSVQKQLDQDGGSFQLPVPRSSSSRSPHLGPDRPSSLVPSVYDALSPEHRETTRGGAGATVAEHMDRVQGAMNTSVQGRVREQKSEDFGRARAHKERLARLGETDAAAPKRTAGAALAASSSRAAAASRTPKSSPLAQEVTFPQHAVAPPQPSPSTKFPACYAPNARTPGVPRVTMMNLPPPEQSVPSSPSVYSVDLENMCHHWTDPVDDSDDSDDDRFSVSQKPRLRRIASMSDVGSYSDVSESSLWHCDQIEHLNDKLYEQVMKMAAPGNAPKPVKMDRRAELPTIGTLDVSRRVDVVHPNVTVEPGDTVAFVGWNYTEEDTPTDTRGPATPTVVSAKASAPAKRSSVSPELSLQRSKTRTSTASHASSSTSSHRSSAAALSRSSSQESSCSAAPSVPPKDVRSKPADLRRTPSSSTRDKPIAAVQPGSVREIASRFQGAATSTAPTKSAQRHTEVVPPPPVQRPTSANATKPSIPRASSPRTTRDEGRPLSKTPVSTERSALPSHLETTRQTPSDSKSTPSRHSRASSRQYTPELEPGTPRRAVQDPVSAASTSASSRNTSSVPPRSPGLPAQGAHNPADAQRADKRARRQGIVASSEVNRQSAANSEGAALARNETYSAGVKAVSTTKEGNTEVTVYTLDPAMWGGSEADRQRSSKRTSAEKSQRAAGSSRR